MLKSRPKTNNFEESKSSDILEMIYNNLSKLCKYCDLECPKPPYRLEYASSLLSSIIPIVKARFKKANDNQDLLDYKISILNRDHGDKMKLLETKLEDIKNRYGSPHSTKSI